MFKTITAQRAILWALMATLVGCAAQPVELDLPADAPAEISFEPYRTLAAQTRWQVGSNQFVMEVYRAGRLARLGHNHIISSTGLAGMIFYDAANVEHHNAFADLYLPLATLNVDNTNLRALAGGEFASKPSSTLR